MICPKCGNADKVYVQGMDPIEGWFVICMVHGLQVVKKDDQIPKREI